MSIFHITDKEPPLRPHCGAWREDRSLAGHRHLDWGTRLRTVPVGDFTLILPSVLHPDRIYYKLTVFLGQRHSAVEIQALAIEEPADGESRVFWEAGEGHRTIFCYCGVVCLEGGLCHRLCEGTEERTE